MGTYDITYDKGDFEVLETQEGFLKAKVTIAKPGVFPYVEDGQIIYHAKLPQDLFSKTTIDSAKGAPVVGDPRTQDHPRASDNVTPVLVDSENYSQYVKGNISEPKIENDKLVAYETIYDRELINEIQAGNMREVSIGFTHNTDMQGGEYNGQAYDRAQTNIVINHVAHVDRGRAGRDVKIHVDRGQTMSDKIKKTDADESTSGKKFSYRKFDSAIDISVDKEIHDELMLLRKHIKADALKIDELEKELNEIKADSSQERKIKRLEGAIDTLQSSVDSWKEQYQELKNSIPEQAAKIARDRADIIDFAKSVDKDMSFDGLSNDEIKLQVIAKGLPFKEGVDVGALSIDAINARYDAACELLREKANLTADKEERKIDMTVDRNVIQEKRVKLQNIYGGAE